MGDVFVTKEKIVKENRLERLVDFACYWGLVAGCVAIVALAVCAVCALSWGLLGLQGFSLFSVAKCLGLAVVLAVAFALLLLTVVCWPPSE